MLVFVLGYIVAVQYKYPIIIIIVIILAHTVASQWNFHIISLLKE